MQNSYVSKRPAYPIAMVVNMHHKPTWRDDHVLVPNAGLRVPVVNIPQGPHYRECQQTDLNSIIIADEVRVKSDLL